MEPDVLALAGSSSDADRKLIAAVPLEKLDALGVTDIPPCFFAEALNNPDPQVALSLVKRSGNNAALAQEALLHGARLDVVGACAYALPLRDKIYLLADVARHAIAKLSRKETCQEEWWILARHAPVNRQLYSLYSHIQTELGCILAACYCNPDFVADARPPHYLVENRTWADLFMTCVSLGSALGMRRTVQIVVSGNSTGVLSDPRVYEVLMEALKADCLEGIPECIWEQIYRTLEWDQNAQRETVLGSERQQKFIRLMENKHFAGRMRKRLPELCKMVRQAQEDRAIAFLHAYWSTDKKRLKFKQRNKWTGLDTYCRSTIHEPMLNGLILAFLKGSTKPTGG